MKPGSVLGNRYHIEALAGRGGMAAVYRARDRDGTRVAIKCIEPPPGKKEPPHSDSHRRFAREVLMLEELRHPAIVTCLDHGMTRDGRLYLVMEWLDGMSLEDQLLMGPLAVADAVGLAARMAGALGVVHQHGMVHRDVKPGNIFLPRGNVALAKLLDFGAARWNAAVTLTAADARIGTPNYMAPEQISASGELGPSADVFALGCVLYECLSGRMAFEGEGIGEMIVTILTHEPEPVSQLVTGLPPALVQLIDRMLAKAPESRPRDGAQMERELHSILVEVERVAKARALPRS